MNQRIKELMGKTLDDKFSHTWDTMTYEGLLVFSEKFAQLIIRECVKSVTCNEALNILDRFGIDSEHFGVEE